MKKNFKYLLSGLLAVVLLTGCSTKTTSVTNGDDNVGTVKNPDNTNVTDKNLQNLYEELKTTAGGTTALDFLTKEIATLEYDEYIKGTKTANATPGDDFDIKSYRNKSDLKKDIEDFFEDIAESDTYKDDDDKFDEDEYVESLEDAGYTVDKTTSTNPEYMELEDFKYNYDEYIEDVVIKDLYVNYMYEDYVLSTSKYRGQFATQYPIRFEVLKFSNYTTAQSSHFSESLRIDVQAVLTGKNTEAGFKFNASNNSLYSFTTFDSEGNLIDFKATSSGLKLTTYKANETTEALYEKLYNREILSLASVAGQVSDAIASTEVIADESYEINTTSVVDENFFKAVEKINISRELYRIDTEVSMARNYDLDNEYYQAYTKDQQNNAKTFASTYSNSNARPIKEGAVVSKRSAEKGVFYTEDANYTSATYGNVLPSDISALLGVRTADLQKNILTFNGNEYLLPNKDGLQSPLYTDGSYYYVVKVNYYYGYHQSETYKTESNETRTVSKNITNYQIEAYQKGSYTTYKYDEATHNYVVDEDNLLTVQHPYMVSMVQDTASAILTANIRVEALVRLFEKYGLSIHDQEIYDYIEASYPKYFED